MIEFVLYIENGIIANKKHVKEGFENLEDGRYQVTIKPRKRRSNKQNAYYHAVVCDMVKDGLRDIGYRDVEDAEDAHEVLKSLFLKKKTINHNTGEVLSERDGSTKKLSTTEMQEYIDKCVQFAAEYLGVSIPQPGQQGNFFQ